MDALMLLKDLGIIVGMPMARSFSGWAAKAFEDDKVTEFEWRQLAATVMRVGTMGFMGYFGFAIAGFDQAAVAAAVSAFVADKVINLAKKFLK